VKLAKSALPTTNQSRGTVCGYRGGERGRKEGVRPDSLAYGWLEG
jgi:hypothetical protein